VTKNQKEVWRSLVRASSSATPTEERKEEEERTTEVNTAKQCIVSIRGEDANARHKGL